ncbi:MAG TPA: hypothetical protein VFQ96_07770, partial [Microbacteriaceae bacterium]|nr:hypothetical protein [Microbacteriaceae bacterium]
DMLGTLNDIHVESEQREANGRYLVTASYRIAPVGDGHELRAGHTTFALESAGAIAGVLPRWRFAVSPIAVARVAVRGSTMFTLAGHTLDARAAAGESRPAFSAAGDYLLLTPASVSLRHSNRLTTASPVRLDALTPGALVTATVTARPTPEFTARVRDQLKGYLDSCAEQTVLQPAGCPMGKPIDNRVVGSPTWHITAYPKVSLVAGPSGWIMPPTPGRAEIDVRVQSLFDGSVRDERDTVVFQVSVPKIVIQPDGSLAISVAG